MKRGLFAGMVVLLSGIIASAALIPTGTTIVYIDGKPYACFLFNGQAIDYQISVIPAYISPPSVALPELSELLAIDWANIPVPYLDTTVIGLGQYGYPDIDSLSGTNQIVYVPELGEFGYLAIPEPASFLLIAAGSIWARRKKTERPS